jgi:S1-C subfamily serine protease
MVWVIVPIMIASMTGGFMKNSGSRNRSPNSASSSASTSFLGSHYKTAQGGAFIEDITPPGSAADKAGLVGGDVITSFDGKPVKSESDLTNVLTQTPVGKTVEVTFVRDGETKTVKLTTVSEQENDRLEEVFNDRHDGRGRLGFDDDDTEVVPVPGTNYSGVRLDDITENYPADIAGVREGDVVIQFDGTPIRTVQELVMRIRRAVPYSTINLVVMRAGERLEIPVKVGKQ